MVLDPSPPPLIMSRCTYVYEWMGESLYIHIWVSHAWMSHESHVSSQKRKKKIVFSKPQDPPLGTKQNVDWVIVNICDWVMPEWVMSPTCTFFSLLAAGSTAGHRIECWLIYCIHMWVSNTWLSHESLVYLFFGAAGSTLGHRIECWLIHCTHMM